MLSSRLEEDGPGYQATCSEMVFVPAQESYSGIFLTTGADFTQDCFCLAALGFTHTPCSTLLLQCLLEKAEEEGWRAWLFLGPGPPLASSSSVSLLESRFIKGSSMEAGTLLLLFPMALLVLKTVSCMQLALITC